MAPASDLAAAEGLTGFGLGKAASPARGGSMLPLVVEWFDAGRRGSNKAKTRAASIRLALHTLRSRACVEENLYGLDLMEQSSARIKARVKDKTTMLAFSPSSPTVLEDPRFSRKLS